MIQRTVILSPEARVDLIDMYNWIAHRASPVIAARFMGDSRRSCQDLIWLRNAAASMATCC